MEKLDSEKLDGNLFNHSIPLSSIKLYSLPVAVAFRKTFVLINKKNKYCFTTGTE